MRGVGYRLELTSRSTPSPPPELDHLAPPLDAFIGRAATLRELAGRLENARWITVTGPAGVGKTRLVLELAESRSQRLSIDVSGLSTLTALRAQIQTTLKLERAVSDAELGTRLADRGVHLLLLDGADALSETPLDGATQWLRAAPELRILATSRRRLGLPGETLFRVEPLNAEASRALFLARAASMGRTPEDTPTLDQLIERLDGLPLALELAAARSRLLDVPSLNRSMKHRFRLLRQAEGRSLEGALATSWSALSPEQQHILGRLSTFRGWFSLTLAERILEDLEIWPLDALETLVDRSLVQVSDGGFRLLASIRAFAERQLSADELEQARDAHVVALSKTWSSPLQTADLEAATDWGRPLDAAGMCLLNLLQAYRNQGQTERSHPLLADWLERPGLSDYIRASMHRENGWLAYMSLDAEGLRHLRPRPRTLETPSGTPISPTTPGSTSPSPSAWPTASKSRGSSSRPWPSTPRIRMCAAAP